MSLPMGPIQRITLHWTAGNYTTNFDDYHFCIKADGSCVKTRPLSEEGAHTWMRNSGNIGLAFDGEEDAHPVADGHGGEKPAGSPFPITPHQIETMAKAVAELCVTHDLALHGVVKLPHYQREGAGTDDDRLVPTGGSIMAPTVTDHRWYAVQDQYEADRWDIADLLPVVMEKAAWYLAQLRCGAQHIEHTA